MPGRPAPLMTGSRMKWWVALPFISTALFVLLAVLNPRAIEERVEVLTLDYRFHLRNLIAPPPVPEDIVIVTVDEESLRTYGRWPWPRKLQSQLIRSILKMGPKVLAIDILYPETETNAVDEEMGRILEQHRGSIVLATSFNIPSGEKEEQGADAPPDFLMDSAFTSVKDLSLGMPIRADRASPPVKEIGMHADLGHAYNLKDIDGTNRWEVLCLEYDGDYYPSLSLQAARLALGLGPEDMSLYLGRGVALGDRLIPFDPFGSRMLINYLGKERTFRYVPAADILRATVDQGILRNRLVFLGTSAIATYDMISTPFSANMPGVEKNATVLENILSHRFIAKIPKTVEIAVIVLAGVLIGILFARMDALRVTVFSFITIAVYLVLAQVLFSSYRLWIGLVYPLGNMLVIFTGVVITKYLLEEKKAREIRAMFSSYVSPKIVAQLISDPERARLGGDRKVVTVLFSDIMGFTSLSERTPPEKVVALLNEYFEEMATIIFKWDGTLDKFVGDEIMAFWGAPLDQPDHAERAVRCSLDMMARLSELQKRWRARGDEVLDCGIGINSGEVVVGNIGAQGKKMDYTLIGDHVNIAARVEKLTRTYNTKIIITEHTLDSLDAIIKSGALGHTAIEFLDSVTVKGKAREMRIFEVKNTGHHKEAS